MAKHIYPPDHGNRISQGHKEGRKRQEYFRLGCPIPPPPPFEEARKNLVNSISQDEVTMHLIKTKQL